MDDLSALLDEISATLLAGDFPATDKMLRRMDAVLQDSDLAAADMKILRPKIDRVQRLSNAAATGIDASRLWLRDLQQVLGGLDVYGPEGRQRVETTLSGKFQRF